MPPRGPDLTDTGSPAADMTTSILAWFPGKRALQKDGARILRLAHQAHQRDPLLVRGLGGVTARRRCNARADANTQRLRLLAQRGEHAEITDRQHDLLGRCFVAAACD